MKFAQKIRLHISNEITKAIKDGERLSLAMDEWTSIANRRYFNLVVFTKTRFWNQGLIRIRGSMPSTKFKEVLQEVLSSFDINMEHIVGCTTDGASVMIKFGKEINPVISQICLVHGIHLSVQKALYKIAYSNENNTVSDDLDDNEEDLLVDEKL
jgi:hypothetical protein